MRRLLLVLPVLGMAVLNTGCMLDKDSRDPSVHPQQAPNPSQNPRETWETPAPSSIIYPPPAQWFHD